jgi:EAL and modified HD-GYP domain-containing signal transduction protein
MCFLKLSGKYYIISACCPWDRDVLQSFSVNGVGVGVFESVMLARQPIFKKDKSLYGFELLYRNDAVNQATISNAFSATSELLENLCSNALQENLNLNLPLFINIDEEFITSSSFFPGPSVNLILEILETVQPTPKVLEGIKTLRAKGFHFALDDYTFCPSREAFLPLMSIIKVDLLELPLDEIALKMQRFKGTRKILLAEKVEDRDTYERCLAMGFNLFQGYFLERPTIIKGNKVLANKQVLIKLIAQLCREDISIDEVSEIISCDPRFIFKILKIVNCPLYPFIREVENIRQAVIMLGLESIKKWALVMVIMSDSNAPKELFRVLLTRAKTCELFAQSYYNVQSSDYFTLGLFSGMDAVLETKLEDVLNEINLAAPLKQELLHGSENYHRVLADVRAYQLNQQGEVQGFNHEKFQSMSSSFTKGMKWTDELMTLL